MDDPDDTYAPQSPDLSAYHSSAVSIQPPSYYPQQTQHQPAYPQPLQYNTTSSFSNQLLPQSLHQSAPQVPPRNRRTKIEMDDEIWAPEPSTQRASRKSKKPKVEEDFGKLAPGVEEGIEVKTKFPVARIKRIMQADEDVGKVAQVTPTAVCGSFSL